MDQPEVVQEWLLKTAVLDRFCPDLCDALNLDSSAALILTGHSSSTICTPIISLSYPWINNRHGIGITICSATS